MSYVLLYVAIFVVGFTVSFGVTGGLTEVGRRVARWRVWGGLRGRLCPSWRVAHRRYSGLMLGGGLGSLVGFALSGYNLTARWLYLSACLAFYAMQVVLYLGMRREARRERVTFLRRAHEERIRVARENSGPITREASDRAWATLRAALSPEQLTEWSEFNCFRVRGSSGTEYAIGLYHSYNITNTRTGMRYCIMSLKKIPAGDSLLAQKLWIEADEAMFLRTANRAVPSE